MASAEITGLRELAADMLRVLEEATLVARDGAGGRISEGDFHSRMDSLLDELDTLLSGDGEDDDDEGEEEPEEDERGTHRDHDWMTER